MILYDNIPLLEFDPDPSSVLLPKHEHLDMCLPEKAVFAFLGDYVDRYAAEHHAVTAGKFLSATKQYPVYILRHGGENVCLMQAPVGAPAAVQILDWLLAYGVRKVISGGSCGVLQTLEENVFLLPYRALRDEGTSYHYMPPSRFVDIHPQAQKAIETALAAHHLPFQKVITWTTDGFFRETKEKVRARRAEGCSVVEMECSALAACASLRGAVWGELLYTADSLAQDGNYDERGWGGNSIAAALDLCLDAVLYL